MTKEKLVSLKRYLDEMTNLLNAPLPEKHSKRAEAYKAFIAKEIKGVTAQLEAARLEGVVETKK